jgi:ketosteroid isomerase-like protein
MSQENVAVIEEVMAAWNSHDLERWLRCWDPTCNWRPRLRGQVEGAQTYRGHEGLRRYWEEDDAVWDEFHVELSDFRHVGEDVVAVGVGRARGKESGVDTTSPLAFRFRIRDGRIVRGESYLDVNEALDGVGLSE